MDRLSHSFKNEQMKRILWHLLGAVGTLLFAVGSISFFKPELDHPPAPSYCWAVVAIVGFVGILYYADWYRGR